MILRTKWLGSHPDPPQDAVSSFLPSGILRCCIFPYVMIILYHLVAEFRSGYFFSVNVFVPKSLFYFSFSSSFTFSSFFSSSFSSFSFSFSLLLFTPLYFSFPFPFPSSFSLLLFLFLFLFLFLSLLPFL